MRTDIHSLQRRLARWSVSTSRNARRHLMYARVVTANFKTATMERGLHTLQDQVRPNVSKQPGFQDWEVLADRQTGVIQTTTHWASEAEARAASATILRERTG